MNEQDKGWIKYIVAAMLLGFIIGEFLSHLLGLFLTSASWALLVNVVIPLCMIACLLIVLYLYQKDKDDVLK